MVKERLNMHDFVGSPLAYHFEASMAREPSPPVPAPTFHFAAYIFAGMDVEFLPLKQCVVVCALLLVGCVQLSD